MNRFQAPSTLSYRERNNASAGSSYNSPSSYSARSSPYGTALGNEASTSSNSVHSTFRVNGSRTPKDSLPQWQDRTAEQLETQNDELIEGIGAKVQQLKMLAKGIGEEAKTSALQLTEMNDAFAETSGILGGTFRRMNAMAKRQGGRWMCYMLFLVIVFWFFVVVWWFRR